MIKEFLLQNWYYIALIFIAFCNMFLLIFKKNKVVSKDTIFEQLLEILPSMIRSVEGKGLSGVDKKNLVISLATSWLSRFNYEVNASVVNRIGESIENILSTPEKKGDN